MNDKIKFLAFVAVGLLLGCIFGAITRKIVWYVSSGIVIGLVLAIAFTRKG